MTEQLRDIINQGLWKNNPALVQLLGLCPLLAVSATITNALGLGLATLFVLLGSNVTVAIVREWVPKEIRIPVFVMIIAAFVTMIELLMNAFSHELYLSLGIFIPLIVTNCAIIGRAEAFASKNSVPLAAFDGLMMGLGFLIVLVMLGAMRELLGQGTLFDGAHLLLGDWAKVLRIEVMKTDTQFLLAVLSPGAFLGMGLLIALKNTIDAKQQAKQIQPVVEKAPRARVTSLD